MSNLGVLYEHGLGVERDFRQAARWYRAAAENGVGEAQYNLASLYMAGKGLPLDYFSADYWYSMARRAGDKRTLRKLKDLERLMGPRQLSGAQTLVSNLQLLQRQAQYTPTASRFAASKFLNALTPREKPPHAASVLAGP